MTAGHRTTAQTADDQAHAAYACQHFGLAPDDETPTVETPAAARLRTFTAAVIAAETANEAAHLEQADVGIAEPARGPLLTPEDTTREWSKRDMEVKRG